ncbi:hypothetical protein BGW39_002429 [Mortierella sp. 14UC]|nr:hypothetical protein BGW39_002429 [Mortierella sp. 14UC]
MEYQDDLGTISTTGSLELYRDEILAEYHAIAVGLDSRQHQYQEQQQKEQQQQQQQQQGQDQQQQQQHSMTTALTTVSMPRSSWRRHPIPPQVRLQALSLLSLIKFLKPILAPVIDILTTAQTTILNTFTCFANKGYHLNRLEQQLQQQDDAAIDKDTTTEQQQPLQVLEQEPLSIGRCSWIAKNYQDLVRDAIVHNPVTKGLLDGSSEDLRRVVQGALDTLEWMQKYSVTSNLNLSNDNSNNGGGVGVNLATEFALTGRPFFAGKILHQYMVSLLEVGTSAGVELQQHGDGNGDYDVEHDETVLYALTSLGLTVNMSNVLETCLSTATIGTSTSHVT